jgi:hypothetical protein
MRRDGRLAADGATVLMPTDQIPQIVIRLGTASVPQ